MYLWFGWVQNFVIIALQNECFRAYTGIGLSVCPCVQNTSLDCQSAGRGKSSHLVTVHFFFFFFFVSSFCESQNLFQRYFLFLQKKEKKKEKKKSKKKEKDKDKEKLKERRPFDREVDLQVNRLDEAQKRAIIKRSQELGSRFKTGGMGTSFLWKFQVKSSLEFITSFLIDMEFTHC